MLKQPVTDVLCPLHFSKWLIYPLLNEGSNIYIIYIYTYTWNPKQPALNGCLAKQQFVKSRFGIISSRFKKSLFGVEIMTRYTAYHIYIIQQSGPLLVITEVVVDHWSYHPYKRSQNPTYNMGFWAQICRIMKNISPKLARFLVLARPLLWSQMAMAAIICCLFLGTQHELPGNATWEEGP